MEDLRAGFSRIMGDQKERFTGSGIPPLLLELGLADFTSAPSKREKLQGAVEASSNSQILAAAIKALTILKLTYSERCFLQEMIWLDFPYPVIPTRFRRDAASQLSKINLSIDHKGFYNCLSEFWPIHETKFIDFDSYDGTATLREKIMRHYVEGNDWNAHKLFDELGAFQTSNARFVVFLEGLVSSSVRPDEDAQREFIVLVNQALQPCGVRFVETLADDGYLAPSLEYISSGQRGSPKNLIFASADKPDLRFRDALDNDVEIVSNADKVLIYDRTIKKVDCYGEISRHGGLKLRIYLKKMLSVAFTPD
ncbi:hypothetical protein M2401_004690 [Pseudomonas sp. JUb42]|uniref:AbiJ-related protein n=1 Tax=Pseudomonas sp. JUb42 TaxID=2940611 RepID=UPI0021689E3C|nr:hypothetical protein [Pseudomonas sp. JUb42]MCS3470932.1 hypothetical protein [Pseudomonas sp. JUb42]